MQFWNITFATLDGMCGRCVEGKLSWHSSSPIYVGVPSMRRVCESTPKVWEEICLILTPLRVPAFVFSIPSGLRKFRQNEVMEINQIVVGTQSLNLTHRKSSRKTFWKSNHISHKQKEKPVRSNKHMTSQLKMLQHHGSWKGHVRKRKNPKVEMTSEVQIVELPPNLLRWGFIVFLSCFRFHSVSTILAQSQKWRTNWLTKGDSWSSSFFHCKIKSLRDLFYGAVWFIGPGYLLPVTTRSDQREGIPNVHVDLGQHPGGP